MDDIRTFHARRGRVSLAQVEALETILPRYAGPAGQVDVTTVLDGRPVVLEIGFGLGHATLEMAQAQPEVGIIALDVHTPGVARLVIALDSGAIDNVRVVHGDAVAFIRERIPAGSLAGIRAFFPDPWPKARHHKRRLIRPDLVTLMASRLEPGGLIHVATDWAPYAEQMREVLDAEPMLRDCYHGPAPRLERPMTKFERQGLEKGHEVVDLVYART